VAGQIRLDNQEQQRLGQHIWDGAIAARSNHDARIERFRRYYRMWRGLSDQQATDGDGKSFDVPMLKWINFGHWSRVMAALLGDDAEIIAKPTAPIDEKLVKKAGIYETWRVFEYMKATPQLAAWTFRTVLYGRAHAYCPYDQEHFVARNPQTGKMEKQLSYDGPRTISLSPSEIILPAQVGVQHVSDFDWKIRRLQGVTPQELLDGENEGIYFGIKDRWNEIMAFAEQRQERDYWLDDEQIDQDIAEGVNHYSLMGARDTLEVWKWYGKWRMKRGEHDSSPNDILYRALEQSEILVSYLPRLQMVIGVQDLRELYPVTKKRDPFCDIGLTKDGSYWCPGVGELIEALQRKSTANYALFERAGKFSVGPVIFYKPTAGNFDPDTFVYAPNTAVPTEDPGSIQIVNMKADLSFSEQNQQALSGFAEKVTGISDQTLGQSIDRPNAPRTAAGQMALIEQGNVRASLDMSFIQDDLSQWLEWIWGLDRTFAGDEIFFRVTGDDANGLFDTDKGFGKMTAEERQHQFDFQLKFANSVWSKEAKKQQVVQLYQMAMANPLCQQNPRALWMLLDKVWKALGDSSFSEIIPAPPEVDTPISPTEEWSMALRGEDIHVNPLDDDQAHLIDHRKRLDMEQSEDPEKRDQQAEAIMVQHIMEHHAQMRQKQVLAAIAQKIQQELQQQNATSGVGPVQPQNPMPIQGAPPQGQPDQGGGQPTGPAAAAQVAGPQGIGGPPSA
jgi:hypothetical protein